MSALRFTGAENSTFPGDCAEETNPKLKAPIRAIGIKSATKHPEMIALERRVLSEKLQFNDINCISRHLTIRIFARFALIEHSLYQKSIPRNFSSKIILKPILLDVIRKKI